MPVAACAASRSRAAGRRRHHRRHRLGGDALGRRARRAIAKSKIRRAASGRCCSRLAKKRSCRARMLACSCRPSAYEFLRFDTRRNAWVPIDDDELYRHANCRKACASAVARCREVVLKPQPPNRSDEDEHKKWPPQIMVLVERRHHAVRIAHRARSQPRRCGASSGCRTTICASSDAGHQANASATGSWWRRRKRARRIRMHGSGFPMPTSANAPMRGLIRRRERDARLHADRSAGRARHRVARHARRDHGRRADGEQQHLSARQDHRALGGDESSHRSTPAAGGAEDRQDHRMKSRWPGASGAGRWTVTQTPVEACGASTSACGRRKRDEDSSLASCHRLLWNRDRAAGIDAHSWQGADAGGGSLARRAGDRTATAAARISEPPPRAAEPEPEPDATPTRRSRTEPNHRQRNHGDAPSSMHSTPRTPASESASRQTAPGFTLLEVLIAVAIFVIVGALAMGGYNELVKQSDIVESMPAHARRATDRAAHGAGLRHARAAAGARSRSAIRSSLPCAPTRASRQLADLTHSGWSNPAGVPRSTLQRVAYRLEDNKLRRDYWVVLDRTHDRRAGEHRACSIACAA